jgi:DNA-directed RNA polymerase specialized sigma24 family protein
MQAAGAGGRQGAEDAESFTWFFRAEFPAVVKTVWLVLHDRGRAEEVTQDAFVQLLRHWPKVVRYQRPDAWVRRVAIRMAVRAARREALGRVLERGMEAPVLPAPVDVDLLQAVRRLPPGQRAAVVLFYFEDRPVSEIAQILGCAESTAKAHLFKARRRLAELLGEAVADVS